MDQEQAQQLLKDIGIKWGEDDGPYPLDSESGKIDALYKLVAGWIEYEVKNGNMIDQPEMTWEDWVREGMEEFLFG